METEGIYQPDSEKVFKLLDKEISIKDAVCFFKEYINEMPSANAPTMKVRVIEVRVLMMGSSVYGYYFTTTVECEGVLFDYLVSGMIGESVIEKHVPIIGHGFMITSDDVDIRYGGHSLNRIEKPVAYEKVLSIDKAIKTISGKVTAKTEFAVEKIEFVYLERELPLDGDGGPAKTENYSSKIIPTWKFTLNNVEEGIVYVIYLEAKEGGEYMYYQILPDPDL